MSYRQVLSIEQELFGIDGLAINEQAVEINPLWQGRGIQGKLSLSSFTNGEAFQWLSLYRMKLDLGLACLAWNAVTDQGRAISGVGFVLPEAGRRIAFDRSAAGRLTTQKLFQAVHPGFECLNPGIFLLLDFLDGIDQNVGKGIGIVVQVEMLDLESGKRLIQITLLALLTVSKILLLHLAAKEEEPLPLQESFARQEVECMKALHQKYEGKTRKQKNPYPANSLQWCYWIMGRLGAWKPGKKKAGVICLMRGVRRFNHILHGCQMAKQFVS